MGLVKLEAGLECLNKTVKGLLGAKFTYIIHDC